MLPAKLAIIDTLAATVTAPDVIVQANNLPATQSAPLIASRVLICTRSGAIHYKWLFYINDMCEMLCWIRNDTAIALPQLADTIRKLLP